MKYTILILSIFLLSCKENLNKTLISKGNNEIVGNFIGYEDGRKTANTIKILKVNDTVFTIQRFDGFKLNYIKRGDTLLPSFEGIIKYKRNSYYLIKNNELYRYSDYINTFIYKKTE